MKTCLTENNLESNDGKGKMREIEIVSPEIEKQEDSERGRIQFDATET